MSPSHGQRKQTHRPNAATKSRREDLSHASIRKPDLAGPLREERARLAKRLRSARIHEGGMGQNLAETKRQLGKIRWYNDFGQSKGLRKTLQAEQALLNQQRKRIQALEAAARRADEALKKSDAQARRIAGLRAKAARGERQARQALEKAEREVRRDTVRSAEAAKAERRAKIRTNDYFQGMQAGQRDLQQAAERAHRYAEGARKVRNGAVIAAATVATGGM